MPKTSHLYRYTKILNTLIQCFLSSLAIPLVACLSSVALVGYTTYVAPSLNSETGAKLNGSRVATSPDETPIRAEPEDIDGKHINNSAFTGDRSLLLSPGPHSINVIVARYTLLPATNDDTFTVNLEAGKIYTIRADFPVPNIDASGQSFSWPNKSHVWIECAGVPITPTHTILLQKPSATPATPILILPH